MQFDSRERDCQAFEGCKVFVQGNLADCIFLQLVGSLESGVGAIGLH